MYLCNIEEKSIRKRDQLVRINVKIEATNGYETAITGVLPYNSEVVKWTTKPLREGMNVRVVEGRGEKMKNRKEKNKIKIT
ncbi:hypothetical protein EQM13_06425 [Acidilutibacter cellobiosedens]|uniref:Uncharacterized protein n=1 Tax=Acidilutibacter cellobiosedens TaxID=2507161 RepID=A0A410QBB0_9FIRM|nr:hypothetical protein [Acidilutibacter cellobiosedens]QAT61249.1 hypothetical protein EQM13_06425 [Acidilutibacter cellobiosedens]